MKKFMQWVSILLCAALLVFAAYFAFAFFGNPISWLAARFSSSRYLEENFGDSHFRISKVGYNFKTGRYFTYVDSPTSQDSYFTIYFDNWGRYEYDSFENITTKYTTYIRVDEQYRELIKSSLPYVNGPFEVSIAYGELRDAQMIEIYSYIDENGNTQTYTLDKEYGLIRSELEPDKEYDIQQIGRDCGSICLYIHDPEVTVERAAELLLEVKAYLDKNKVPFHAIDFHLTEPRNEQGQYTEKEITLFDFLYSDIYEEGLVDRVQEHWNIAQEHYAVQDGLKSKPSFINKE